MPFFHYGENRSACIYQKYRGTLTSFTVLVHFIAEVAWLHDWSSSGLGTVHHGVVAN